MHIPPPVGRRCIRDAENAEELNLCGGAEFSGPESLCLRTPPDPHKVATTTEMHKTHLHKPLVLTINQQLYISM
ncbi:GM20870 [Drosophila sechellia]|uniref:GM20870 n=1 Tax=Drosophila sechellia TaxID=7238 RepID=B4HPV4_DROSE|nr:GM20870 [Drosophila sechellia]